MANRVTPDSRRFDEDQLFADPGSMLNETLDSKWVKVAAPGLLAILLAGSVALLLRLLDVSVPDRHLRQIMVGLLGFLSLAPAGAYLLYRLLYRRSSASSGSLCWRQPVSCPSASTSTK
jgi:hypothetical protein